VKPIAYIFSALLILTGSSCRDREELLQPFAVDVSVNINEPSFFDLTAVGGWVYFNTGTARVILYRSNTEDIQCYDIRSTYDIASGCTVAVESNSVTVKDNCSASKWLLTDGSVVQGPAARPLLEYQTSFDPGSGVFRIFN
jgi:uncharacterized protein YuzB (UPF0349 family)